LAGLIKDFPKKSLFRKPLTPEKAFLLIRARWLILTESIDDISNVLLPSSNPSTDRLGFIIKFLHRFLYKGILSNAGDYRHAKDPNGGIINFGGQRRSESLHKYQGSVPSQIENDLHISIDYLIEETDDPIEAAIRFYQAFVRCHPFYDANGRIGRLIITMFLRNHHQHTLWAEMEAGGNSKFIKKLNHCHDRQGQPNFDRYLSYLVDYFRKYVRPFTDYDDSDIV